MSVFAEITDEVATLLKSAGQEIETFAISETHKVVALFINSDYGTKILNLISLAEAFGKQDGKTGAQKFEAVVAALVGDATSFMAAGGFPGLVLAAENLARAAVQLVFADFVAEMAKIAAPAAHPAA
jgi:hypothetical protein